MPDLATPVTPNDHTAGPASAPITLVEYGDYQCPSCGQAHPVVKRLQQQLGDKLRFVFRNYPLPQHAFAEPAAETAEFAAAHDKFWPMHDTLFQHQRRFSKDIFPHLAETLSLDPKALTKALDDQTFADRVQSDVDSGDKSHVRATPSFFINGTLFDDDFDYDPLLQALQAAAR